MTEQNIQAIKDAIKAQKWNRSSYEYALNAMLPYRYWDVYKKPELIANFYEAIETRFNAIKTFTTFRHLSI